MSIATLEAKKPKCQYPYNYKIRNRYGVLDEYTGSFETKRKAYEWYIKHGFKKEQESGLKLVLCYFKSELK